MNQQRTANQQTRETVVIRRNLKPELVDLPAGTTLCLDRRKGERLIIGDLVVIEVVICSRGCARLRITAPEFISIDREDVWRKKKAMESGQT